MSLATSTVAVSVASVASGTDATLTLTARDAAGNALDSGGLVVLFTKGTGTSDGMISATTDNGDGTYTATFTGTIAGSARAIGATIGGNAITGAAPPITVTPGTLSLATSSVTTSSDTVTSGVEVALTLTTRDAAGNALSAGGRTVLFTKGAGSSDGTISATTDNANGTYTATFTGTTAGTARALGATVDGNALTSAAPTVMVKPGALSLAQSSVAVSASSIASGTGTTLTLTTRDAAGNTFTSGGLAVLFSKGSGTSEGTISAATDNGNGTYTATFTATTAGTARAIGATVAGNAVTSAAPTITVTPGAIAVGTSTVSTGATTLVIGTTTTVTLTAFDAAGNRITTGGATVEFGLGSGSSTGTFSTVSDVGNGTYTAVFTATGSGTARQVTATIGAVAVTTTLPTITVTAPLMSLSTDSVTINAQIETAAASQLLTVASIAGGTIGGLNTLVTALPGGPSNCASVNWLATPTFDMGGVASPVSLMTLQASAVGLALGSCAREVIVRSATSDVISRRVVVVLNVGRSPAAAGVVSVVMMGDANNPSAQLISPTPVLTISNGGRGTINNVAAQILSQSLQTNGCFDTVPPCDPWLAPADLVLSSTTLPVTLSIIATARPFGASAIVRITGNGMTARDFEINVRFNQEPEMVTNPRNLVLRARLGGPVVRDSVLAFNQNQAHPGLESYRLDPGAPALPSWMTVQFVQQIGNSARVRILADPTAFARDTVITDTLGIRLLADFPDTSLVVTLIPKRYRLPYTLIVERGLSLSLANATLFAPVGTTAGTLDLLASHEGAGEVGGLQVTVQSGAPWLSAAFVGGVTATPATLRLTGDPTGITAGTYTSSVTVTSGSGATLQSRTIPVRLTVY